MLNKKNIRKPSLKDIAAKAGLSVSAVSQILNNRSINFCSEEKKEKVRAIADEINYQPNFAYQLLHGMKTSTIGIIFSNPSAKAEEHIQSLYMTLMKKIEAQDYSIYAATMDDSEEKNIKKISSLINRGCMAFIFIGTPVGFRNIENIVISSNLNYISFRAPRMFRRNLSTDTGLAIKEYIGYLKEKGIHDFLYIGGEAFPHRASFISGLSESFPEESPEKLLAQYHHPLGRSIIFSDNFAQNSYDSGFAITRTILKEKAGIQALIYANDYLAIGGAYAILDAGLLPGKDILIRGYNNTKAALFFPYPISSVEHDIEKISDILLKEISDEKPLDMTIPSKLIIRDFNPIQRGKTK